MCHCVQKLSVGEEVEARARLALRGHKVLETALHVRKMGLANLPPNTGAPGRERGREAREEELRTLEFPNMTG